MKKSKVILISDASSGIGRATARAFAALGYNLILMARSRERLEALRRDVESKFDIETLFLQCDFSDYSAVGALFSGPAGPTLELTDLLVNVAEDAPEPVSFYETRVQDWNEVIDTNVKGLLYLIRHTVPHMHKRNAGHVITIGSAASRWCSRDHGVYGAAKLAVCAVSESLRMDLFGTNVRVTNITPGHETRRDSRQTENVSTESNRMFQEDIAEAITWVAEQPEHVNVQEIVMFST